MAKIKTKSTKAKKHVHVSKKTTKTVSHYGFLSGRLNRTGFIVGNLVVFAVLFALGMVFAPLMQKISNIAVLIFICALFICFTVYNVSFSLRRLHDLNKSMLWLLVFFPGYLMILLTIVTVMSAGVNRSFSNELYSFSKSVALLALVSAVANLYYIYLASGQSYKKANEHGDPVTHFDLKEILGIK